MMRIMSGGPCLHYDCSNRNSFGYWGNTNADRIRSMTDEELLKMIYTIGAQLHNKTTEAWLDWLKQEAKDG